MNSFKSKSILLFFATARSPHKSVILLMPASFARARASLATLSSLSWSRHMVFCVFFVKAVSPENHGGDGVEPKCQHRTLFMFMPEAAPKEQHQSCPTDHPRSTQCHGDGNSALRAALPGYD